jgi:hypothetical protein
VTWKNQKPPSGIPARGEGKGPARGVRAKITAETQPTPAAKSIGHEAAKTARESAKAHAEAMLQILVDIAKDATAPHHARSDAAEKVINRAEGRPAQAIGGDPNGVPLRTVVTWEDGPV